MSLSQCPFFARNTAGISRTVFLIGRYAVKVPTGRYGWAKWLRGLVANLQEREWAGFRYPELCPVLASDPLGLVVIMPRAEILARPLTPDELRGLAVRGVELPVEYKPDSFGYLNGNLVAVDYGD